MINKKDYVPKNVLQFIAFLKCIIHYVDTNKTAWNHISAEAVAKLKKLLNDLEVALELATTQRTPAHILARKIAQSDATKEIRQFVNQYLRFNPVTDVDRVEMGIPVRDTIPTPVQDPVGQAEAILSYPGRTQLMLNVQHVSGTTHDNRADYGYRIYYGVYDHDHTPPHTGKDLHESKFTRKKRNLFTFQPEDSGKTAYFCIRYENSKGAAGPWGPLCSAIIP